MMSNNFSLVAANLNTKRFGSCAAVARGLLFVFGGFDGATHLSTIEVFDPVVNGFTLLPTTMTSKRYFACCAVFSVAQHEDAIFIFGGSDGAGRLNTCEVFDVRTRTCTPLPSVMTTRRHGACAAVLRNAILIIGGHDGAQSLSTCEVFTPGLLSFTTTTSPPSLCTKRNFACAGVMHDKVFVVGGHDGVSRLSSCEVYCPKANTFSVFRGTMGARRSGACAAVAHNKMFIVGGTDGTAVWDSCCVLDPLERKRKLTFVDLPTAMTTKRSGAACGIICGRLYVVGGIVQDPTSQLSSCEAYDVHRSFDVFPFEDGEGAAARKELLLSQWDDVDRLFFARVRSERHWSEGDCLALKQHLASLIRTTRDRREIVLVAMAHIAACDIVFGSLSTQAAQALNDAGSVTWKRIPHLGLLFYLRGLGVCRSSTYATSGSVSRSIVTFEYNVGLTLAKLNQLCRAVTHLRVAKRAALAIREQSMYATCDNAEMTIRGIAAKKIQRWYREAFYGYARSQTTRSLQSSSRMSNDIDSLCSTFAWSDDLGDDDDHVADLLKQHGAEDDSSSPHPPATDCTAAAADASSVSSGEEGDDGEGHPLHDDQPSVLDAVKGWARKRHSSK